jgi:hypothetical protein
MLKKIPALFFLLFLLPGSPGRAQVSVRDSSIFIPMIYGTYSFQFVDGGLSKLFGPNSEIGGGFLFKTKSNFLIGAEGNFIFGGDVKISDVLLMNIVTSEGYVIDPNGFFADVYYYERGYNFYAKLGQVFHVLAPNPNCGITVMGGVGFIADKIRIHSSGNDVPAIIDDYAKGYDRYNTGLALTGSLGYTFLSNTRLLNFYLGFEFTQAWTKSRRDYDFDLAMPDNTSYSSQFYGIKVLWIIPLYKRVPNAYYLY